MLELEQRVRSTITTALKCHFAVPKDRQWVFEFLSESILVELAHGPKQHPVPTQPSSSSLDPSAGHNHRASKGAVHHDNSKPEPHTESVASPPLLPSALIQSATASSAPLLTSLYPCDLPETPEHAEALWGPLLYDTLDALDQADLTAFCTQLLGSLAVLAEAEEAGGSAGSEDGSEEGLEGACEMCERVMKLTKHHLIPREVHKEWKRKGASFEDLQAGAMICRSCHSAVHRVADNKTLAKQYNTVHSLMEVESIQRHVAWARKQKVMQRPARSTARQRPRR